MAKRKDKGILHRIRRAANFGDAKAQLYIEKVQKITNCFYCDCEFNNENLNAIRSLDHIIPASSRRRDYDVCDENNYVISCRGCNTLRGGQDFIEFAIKTLLVKTYGSNTQRKKNAKKALDAD